jgi:hypothetical protein
MMQTQVKLVRKMIDTAPAEPVEEPSPVVWVDPIHTQNEAQR